MACAISMPTLSCASAVEAPRCGVSTTFGRSRNGKSGGRRLLLVNVQRGAAHLAALQRLEQRRFVHQPAARAIDDAHALLRFREAGGIQHVMRLRRRRHVHRDEIRARQNLVEVLDQLHLQGARPAGGEIRDRKPARACRRPSPAAPPRCRFGPCPGSPASCRKARCLQNSSGPICPP